MGMKDNTPYRDRPAKEVERERQCMARLFAKASEPDKVYEAFGGLGVSAEEMVLLWPSVRIHAAEIDERCVEYYNRRFADSSRRVRCYHCAAQTLLDIGQWEGNWAASLDFNKFTLLDMRRQDDKDRLWRYQLVRDVIERKPRWVQLTDSAIRYLHARYAVYGLPNKELAGYIDALSTEFSRRWGYKIDAYHGHWAATYCLLKPE